MTTPTGACRPLALEPRSACIRMYVVFRARAPGSEVTFPEWVDFWKNVLAQPEYTEEEVCEELDNMLEGGSWVDWNDGRTT